MNDSSIRGDTAVDGPIPMPPGLSQTQPARLGIDQPKILIVDDEPTTLRVFRKYLADADYHNVLSVSEGAQALEIIQRELPDVVLLDIVMPGMDGLDVLTALRKDTAFEHTPVIILTASTDSQTKRRALELGATDFLLKPIDPTELLPRVRSAVRIKAFHDYYFAYMKCLGSNDHGTAKDVLAAEHEASGSRESEPGNRAVLPKRPSMELHWPVLQPTSFPEVKRTSKVLIVDDEPINIKLIRKTLAMEGYEKIVGTSDTSDWLALIRREMPSVILLDIMMPGISGLDILEQIRADEHLADLPVVILTASTNVDTKRRAFDLGASDFLTKPLDSVELLPRVRNVLLVKAHQDHMRRYADALEREIAGQLKAIEKYAVALETANEMLRRSREAAQVADRAKSRFLANMSHEIRTPLTSIIGFGEVLLNEMRDSVENGSLLPHVETMVKNGRHLLDVVNDVLDLSKIEAGGFSIEMARWSPLEICSDVVCALQIQADRKGLQLELESDGPLPATIQTDAVCLRRILLNLVGNAIKFTERGSVRLSLCLLHDPAEPRLEFRVIDTGIGIPADVLPQLFKPFVQGDVSVARRFGGTGLGLTVSRHLADKLSGTITVESEPGQGSTFCLQLPTASLEGVTLLDASATAASRTGQAPAGASPPIDLSPLHFRILLAEDSQDNQRLISLILRKAGIDVELAENGQIACDKALAAALAGSPFDVILMDMEMPILDGYSATRRLRESGYTCPIVALTAHAMESERKDCLLAGCDDHATKPIQRDALLATISRHGMATRRTKEP